MMRVRAEPLVQKPAFQALHGCLLIMTCSQGGWTTLEQLFNFTVYIPGLVAKEMLTTFMQTIGSQLPAMLAEISHKDSRQSHLADLPQVGKASALPCRVPHKADNLQQRFSVLNSCQKVVSEGPWSSEQQLLQLGIGLFGLLRRLTIIIACCNLPHCYTA